jgi:hypothetical protein
MVASPQVLTSADGSSVSQIIMVRLVCLCVWMGEWHVQDYLGGVVGSG